MPADATVVEGAPLDMIQLPPARLDFSFFATAWNSFIVRIKIRPFIVSISNPKLALFLVSKLKLDGTGTGFGFDLAARLNRRLYTLVVGIGRPSCTVC
ncbi:MAG: hypothetical protein ACYCPP_08225 [Nitrososphaerales archaeon]